MFRREDAKCGPIAALLTLNYGYMFLRTRDDASRHTHSANFPQKLIFVYTAQISTQRKINAMNNSRKHASTNQSGPATHVHVRSIHIVHNFYKITLLQIQRPNENKPNSQIDISKHNHKLKVYPVSSNYK